MKKSIITSILAILATAGTIVHAQDWHEEYLGLPGDNLNLYAVMDLFQESKTLEEFEAKLNDKDLRINNLDLNGDNFIDYITVNDYIDGKIHTIVLRAVLGRNDFQDVAVFIVERKNRNKVRIQLIGDEVLYGRNYIIEPNKGTPNPGYSGDVVYANNVYYYDLSWPMLDWMFTPNYVAWHSSWYWGYWPTWWEPWSPWYWHYYYGYHYSWYPYYHKHYRYWNHPAIHYYNSYYSRDRHYSMNVAHRQTAGQYKKTYSRPDLVSDGEAYYHTVDTRRSNDRAAAAATAGRSTPVQSSDGRASVSTSNDRRSSATVNSRSSNASEVRTGTTTRSNSAPTQASSTATRRSSTSTQAGTTETQKTSTATRSSSTSTRTSTPVSTSRSSETRSSSTPAQATRTETQSISVPTQATRTETRSSSTPTQATRTETRSSSVPTQATRTETRSSSTPAQATRTETRSSSNSSSSKSEAQKSNSTVKETRSSTESGTTSPRRK